MLSKNHTQDWVKRVLEALEKSGRPKEQQIARLMKIKFIVSQYKIRLLVSLT